ANMPGWFLWDTQEMSEIISWMRAYNVSPENEKKLQFYGIDIVAPEYGLNSIFDYLKKFDAAVYEELQSLSFANDLLDDSNWQATLQRVSALPSQEKDVLRANYRSLYDQILHNKVDYISLSGSKDYNWILRLAFNAQQATRMFTADTRLSMGLIRDSAMAANTLWIHRSLAKSEKTIIWAHNVHITKGEFTMTGESESIRGMGYILAQALKDDMISIGASFSQADESTIDGTLAKIGMKFGLLDLKGKTQDQDVINWLNTKKVMLGQGFEMTCIPSKSFDAIFFIDSISRTIPNQASLARFRNLN
ncbi:MAG: erythromycin esterase family protein, partial [Bacteroidales bacterium]|nr:erythromycin esterase family protein [Bacteroidales bacterium]